MDKEKQKILLHYTGSFEKSDTLTARTVGHGLSFMQRIVDKAVMLNKRGIIKKGDSLPAVWYEEADLEVKKFTKGCVTIPLIGPKSPGVVSRLRGILDEPYKVAVSDVDIENTNLLDHFDEAFNRAVKNIDINTHEQVIDNIQETSTQYFRESIYKDFDNIISPLRSAKAEESDEISIELSDKNSVKEFDFTKNTSKRFHKIVSQQKLGPVIKLEGRLTGLNEGKSKSYPYKGTFLSDASENEHKLVISTDQGADELRMFTARKKVKVTIFACPITAWGAFDVFKGDLIFIKVAENEDN